MGQMIANSLIGTAEGKPQGFSGGQMGSKYALPSVIAMLRGEEIPTYDTYTDPKFNTPEFLRPTASYGTPGSGSGGVSGAAGLGDDDDEDDGRFKYNNIFSGEREAFR